MYTYKWDGSGKILKEILKHLSLSNSFSVTITEKREIIVVDLEKSRIFVPINSFIIITKTKVKVMENLYSYKNNKFEGEIFNLPKMLTGEDVDNIVVFIGGNTFSLSDGDVVLKNVDSGEILIMSPELFNEMFEESE